MHDILNLPMMFIVGTCAVIFVATFALGLLFHVIRRRTPPKRVVVQESWVPFEQRRFYNPGALPRSMAALLMTLVLVGGTVSAPFVLGLEQQILGWYDGMGWPAAVVAAASLSAIAWYLLLPKRPRCPSCKSTELDKSLSLPKKPGSIRVYLCGRCRIVWQTKYFVGIHGGTVMHGDLNVPNANF